MNSEDIKEEKAEGTPEEETSTEEAPAEEAAEVAEESDVTEEAPEAAEEDDELTLLKKENDDIIKELADLKDRYQRLAAEYDNFRKRTQKEKADIYPDAMVAAIKEFLPMADNFERAASAETTDEKYKSGVMMIQNQLADAFKKLGVEIIDPKGEEFDPKFEDAVTQIVDENLGDNVVAEVYQKGYRRGDKVIRPAMVAVANC
ncbi:MAG: nucleotide exchange factor GrpE [Oscillospiraceae bacterium]|nr:nucleotide exchange factor GrpE [Oscillospiraceae bacterium]